MLVWVRWIGFLSLTLVLLAGLWHRTHMPGSLPGNCNSLTLWNWLPLCYAMAFFMLETRHAFLAVATILAFFAFCTVLRAATGASYAMSDGSLTKRAHLARGACGASKAITP